LTAFSFLIVVAGKHTIYSELGFLTLWTSVNTVSGSSYWKKKQKTKTFCIR